MTTAPPPGVSAALARETAGFRGPGYAPPRVARRGHSLLTPDDLRTARWLQANLPVSGRKAELAARLRVAAAAGAIGISDEGAGQGAAGEDEDAAGADSDAKPAEDAREGANEKGLPDGGVAPKRRASRTGASRRIKAAKGAAKDEED